MYNFEIYGRRYPLTVAIEKGEEGMKKNGTAMATVSPIPWQFIIRPLHPDYIEPHSD